MINLMWSYGPITVTVYSLNSKALKAYAGALLSVLQQFQSIPYMAMVA
jgi:hypothetical protein